jgi:nucleotide-binding universal stress UspA family protein
MRVLIATDGSEFSKAAIDAACRMVINPENTLVKVIAIVDPPYIPAAEPFAVSAEYIQELETVVKKQAVSAATEAEQKIRGQFAGLNDNLTTQVLRGSPEQVIIEEAQSWNADLIVVGSHGYGFWSRMFLGSVSQAVVLHAPCSVLVVRKTENTNGAKS